MPRSFKTRLFDEARRESLTAITYHSKQRPHSKININESSMPCTALWFSSFMQAREALFAMRKDHEKNDCGFFAFTMVRSPLDWIVSLYDDICHRRLRGHKDTCPQQV